MKITWEGRDVKCGRRVSKPGTTNESIIGYRYDENFTIFSVISLDDGLIIVERKTREDLAVWLSTCEYIPLELMELDKTDQRFYFK